MCIFSTETLFTLYDMVFTLSKHTPNKMHSNLMKLLYRSVHHSFIIESVGYRIWTCPQTVSEIFVYRRTKNITSCFKILSHSSVQEYLCISLMPWILCLYSLKWYTKMYEILLYWILQDEYRHISFKSPILATNCEIRNV